MVRETYHDIHIRLGSHRLRCQWPGAIQAPAPGRMPLSSIYDRGESVHSFILGRWMLQNPLVSQQLESAALKRSTPTSCRRTGSEGKNETCHGKCAVSVPDSHFYAGFCESLYYLWTHLYVGGGFPSPTHSNAAGLYSGAVVKRSGPADSIRGGSVNTIVSVIQ